MNTEEAEKQLKPYLIGDLTPKEEAILEGHLDVNEAAQWYHQRYYRQTLPVLQQPEALPSEGVLEDLFAKARVDIADETVVVPPPMRKLKSYMGANWKVAAMFIIAFGATIGLMLSQKDNTPPTNGGVVSTINVRTGNTFDSPYVFGESVIAGPNEVKVMKFPSGVTIRLAGGTDVAFEELADANDPKKPLILNAKLKRGDVFIEATGEDKATNRYDRVVVQLLDSDGAIIDEGGHAIAEFAKDMPAMASVSYLPKISKIEKMGPVVFMDLKRQTVDELIAAASFFGREITPASELEHHSNMFFDIPTGKYSWPEYRQALANIDLQLSENGSEVVLEKVGGLRPGAYDLAGYSELLSVECFQGHVIGPAKSGDVGESASVVLEPAQSVSPAMLSTMTKTFGGTAKSLQSFEESFLGATIAAPDPAQTIKLSDAEALSDGALVYSTTDESGETISVTLRRNDDLAEAGISGVQGTLYRATKVGSGDDAFTRLYYLDGGQLKVRDLKAN